MPLRDGVCPLGKFKHEECNPGAYDKDPVECCLECNFADLQIKEFEKVCQCPSDMDWDEYDRLRKTYSAGRPLEELSRRGFWNFVRENYRK